MKKFLMCVFLIIPQLLFSQIYESPITSYKSNYFLFGNMNDQALFQLSMKYNLLYPSKYGIFAGYTQKAWWKLYDASSPFDEFNHEPELFFVFKNKNNFLNKNLGIIDYIQFSPICHKSNGEDGNKSKSINTIYNKIQISYGKRYNIGTSLKLFAYYNKEEKDINKYTGYYINEIFLKMKSKTIKYFDKEKFYIRHGFNFNSMKGWMESGLKARLITSRIQPYLFIQLFHGYGESMINYNKKETNIRIGITFK